MKQFLVGMTCATCLGTAAVGQGLLEKDPDVLQITFTHQMEINGESATARGRGFADLTSGVMVIDFAISNYIQGYEAWASSVVTNAGTGGGPVVAITADGDASPALEYLQSGRTLEIEKVTRDEYADLVTQFNVNLEGDTVAIEVKTSGDAKYPFLTGMADGPMVYRAADTKSGPSEYLTKTLTTSRGDIDTQIAIFYPKDLELDYEERHTRIGVLAENEEKSRVRLVYATELK